MFWQGSCFPLISLPKFGRCRHMNTSTYRQPLIQTHTQTRHIVHAKGTRPGYTQLALGCLATSAGCTRQPLLMEEVS